MTEDREEKKPLVEDKSAEVVETPPAKAPPVLVEASQQVKATSGNKDTQKIINQIFSGEDFNTYRSRCLEKPDRAYYTLGPYARLTVEMIEARNLIPCNTSSFDKYFGDTPDAFVKVLVDDTMKYQTKTISNNRNPKWEDKQVFDIVANRSMIRLHVYDSDGDAESTQVDPLGFVEFCVGDIPYGEEIEGWLELRFPANLQGTNLDRYADHCEKREEEWAKSVGISSSTKPPQDIEEGKAPDEEIELDASRKVAHKMPTSFVSRAMKRAKASVQKATASFTGSEYVASGTDDVQFNAGEIHVILKLEKINADSKDELYAHALTPSYFTYASFVQEEALPKLDVQELVDDVMDIKIKLLDDMIFAFYTFILYILSWRSFTLSGMLLLAFLGAIKSASIVYGILHVWLACVLVYLSNEKWRNEISTGGLNAPLTQEGYLMVAAWDKTDEMFAFLMRIIQARLGTVISMQDLVHFAGTLVTGIGQEPDVSFDEVLKVIHDVWFVDMPSSSDLLEKGTLVRVHEHRRGTVKELGRSKQDSPEQEITVQFDEEDWELPGSTRSEDKGVYPRRVVFPRLAIPPIPTPLVPKSVKAILAVAQYHTQDVKEKILPVAAQIRAFFTWQKPLYMSALIAYLLARAALSFFAATSKDSWSFFVISIMADIRNGILGLIVLALLFSRSRGVKMAQGVLQVITAWAFSPERKAPGNWKFYKPPNQPYVTVTPS